MAKCASFFVGQIVHHKLLNYRGVVVDVDPSFQSSDLWYQVMTLDEPPKEKPWYHILVDNSTLITYVAEDNLEDEKDHHPIEHPDLNLFFSEMKNGFYVSKQAVN